LKFLLLVAAAVAQDQPLAAVAQAVFFTMALKHQKLQMVQHKMYFQEERFQSLLAQVVRLLPRKL
jgi:hypothetical protein